ncbi:hypothetical protein AA206_13180 [Salmonella enterica subsp. enterica serovar Newport]|nr:hypothetical protein [Salmonella enterica subsp. enterica serovar Newport]
MLTRVKYPTLASTCLTESHTVLRCAYQCAHLDPKVKAEARRQKLRSIIGGLDTPVAVLSWYCVWCGSYYTGKKHCASCGTGIYSIEKTGAGNENLPKT